MRATSRLPTAACGAAGARGRRRPVWDRSAVFVQLDWRLDKYRPAGFGRATNGLGRLPVWQPCAARDWNTLPYSHRRCITLACITLPRVKKNFGVLASPNVAAIFFCTPYPTHRRGGKLYRPPQHPHYMRSVPRLAPARAGSASLSWSAIWRSVCPFVRHLVTTGYRPAF